jgi:GGDEF domain-containing protein
MRIVSACILMLGLPAALSATNPHSSRWAHATAAFIGIAVAAVGLATPWLGRSWPTRAQSITVVLLGAVLLAFGCGLAANPLAGLLIATAFAFIHGFAALFHGARMQLFVAAASAVTVLTLAVRIAMINSVTALAVVTPVVMLNVAVAFGCRTIAELIAAGGVRTDVEPLTGLLTREGFDELAATLLGARNRDGDRYLVTMIVALDSFAPRQSMEGSRATDQARVAVAQALRDTVRRDALLAHVGDADFLLAETFSTPNLTPLAERVRRAVAATPYGLTASIGVVCTALRPLADRPPHDVIEEAIADATAAMHKARRRGGNQAEYLIRKEGL